MNLKAYLEKHEVSQEEFGKRLRKPVSQGAVWQWCEGKTTPTTESMRDIFAATDGEVTPHDWLPAVFPKGFEFPPEKPVRKAAAA